MPAPLDPLATLRLAEATGQAIRFAADLAGLEALEPWLDRCPLLRELPSEERLQLASALYEALANVVEHGYDGDRSPTRGPVVGDRARAGDGPLPTDGRAGAMDLDARVRAACFVMRDHGRPFRPDGWRAATSRTPPCAAVAAGWDSTSST